MIPDSEMQAYVNLIKGMDTPAPNVTPVPYVYDGNDLSCYGYVTTDAVTSAQKPVPVPEGFG